MDEGYRQSWIEIKLTNYKEKELKETIVNRRVRFQSNENNLNSLLGNLN